MNEEYRRMQKEVEEHRKQRVAQGLPAKKPPRPRGIVPEFTAWALLARCKPLVEFLTAYVRLCDKGNKIIDITPEQDAWLDTFDETLTLLSYADNKKVMYIGQSIGWLVALIKGRSKYEEVEEYITKLFIILQYVMDEPQRFDRNTEIDAEHYAELLKELSERKEVFDKWAIS